MTRLSVGHGLVRRDIPFTARPPSAPVASGAMAVHLLTGDDESLLSAAASELVHRLVGDGDRSLMVDDLDGDDYEVRQLVDAAQTPPFLSDSRIVVGRGHRPVQD